MYSSSIVLFPESPMGDDLIVENDRMVIGNDHIVGAGFKPAQTHAVR